MSDSPENGGALDQLPDSREIVLFCAAFLVLAVRDVLSRFLNPKPLSGPCGPKRFLPLARLCSASAGLVFMMKDAIHEAEYGYAIGPESKEAADQERGNNESRKQ